MRLHITVNGGVVTTTAQTGLYEKTPVVYRSGDPHHNRTPDAERISQSYFTGGPNLLPETGMERRVVTAALLAFRAMQEVYND